MGFFFRKLFAGVFNLNDKTNHNAVKGNDNI